MQTDKKLKQLAKKKVLTEGTMSHLIHRNPDGARKRASDKAASKPGPQQHHHQQQSAQIAEPAQQAIVPKKTAPSGSH